MTFKSWIIQQWTMLQDIQKVSWRYLMLICLFKATLHLSEVKFICMKIPKIMIIYCLEDFAVPLISVKFTQHSFWNGEASYYTITEWALRICKNENFYIYLHSQNDVLKSTLESISFCLQNIPLSSLKTWTKHCTFSM